MLPEPQTEVPSNVRQFHPCKSLACISESVAPPVASNQPLLRRLSEPLTSVCTCPSVGRMNDMEGMIAFVVPELSEKTLMNVSLDALCYAKKIHRIELHSLYCRVVGEMAKFYCLHLHRIYVNLSSCQKRHPFLMPVNCKN